jgi:hypothetical protein
MQFYGNATLKGLWPPSATPSQLLESCDQINVPFFTQGFKENPGLELANAFSVSFGLAITHNIAADRGAAEKQV